MSIIKMKKLAVIGMDTEKKKLLSDLMDLGVVQITDQSKHLEEERWQSLGVRDGDDDKVTALDAAINRIQLSLDVLDKYGKEKSPLFRTRKAVSEEQFQQVMSEEKSIIKSIDRILELNESLHKLQESINKKNTDLSTLTPWKAYDLPLETEETKYVKIHTGIVPVTVDAEALAGSIKQDRAAFEMKEIHRDKDFIYLVTFTMKEDEEEILTTLKQHGYTPLPLQEFDGTVTENLERIAEEIQLHQEEIHVIAEEISNMESEKKRIRCFYDRHVMERDQEKTKLLLIKTKRAFHLEGWVPETCIESVTEALQANQCCFKYREPMEGEEVPVLVVNNSFVQPFEAITSMYSLPDYRGVDPTKYFAIFYVMFFGIMLSDAGYGLVIAAACFVILRKFALEGMTYRMIKMFFFCGIATVFWGAMFGGWFGDFFQVAARVIFNKEITIDPLWFNPIDDPTKLLIYSLAFGVIHIFLGMGIQAAMLIKRGKWKDAVCDIFSWYMVIIGAVLWLGGGFISDGLVKPGMFLTIAGALILLLTGGREKKGVGKIIGGFSSLYNVTSYISDILSYSRLLALGLATGVIAQVVNTMGSLAGGGILGTIVLLVVFLVGHTFNLAINALGAFVHSSRLQYIEFFGKFYEDGGEAFEPFMKNTKYVRFIKHKDGGKK